MNADTLSRPNVVEGECDEYVAGVTLSELPCGGCTYCKKRHEEWHDFKVNVDDIL